MTMKSCVVIPARYASTRFPGKPLVSLLGRPMIEWVADIAANAVGKANVFVATEHPLIANVVKASGYNAIMTSESALTGTDRIAEIVDSIGYDIYINLQGDEPLVDPNDIIKAIEIKKKNPEYIINGYCMMTNDEDPHSLNIPKVITTEDNFLVYMSRNALPGFKDIKNMPESYKKQVCIYAFSKLELLMFKDFGRKSALESIEDIEILRFLELGHRVLMYECKSSSLAVDVPQDVDSVEQILKLRN